MVSKEVWNLGCHTLKEPALSFRLCLAGLQPDVCLDLSRDPELPPASELSDRDRLLAPAWPPPWPRDPLLEAERLEADTVIQSRSILSIHDNTERGNNEAVGESRCFLALLSVSPLGVDCTMSDYVTVCVTAMLRVLFLRNSHWLFVTNAPVSALSPGGIRAQPGRGALAAPRNVKNLLSFYE